MPINFSTFIKKNKQDNKFVLILGSGFHSQGQYSRKNILNDWSTLLSVIEPKVNLTGDPVLDFETIVRYRTTNQTHRKKKFAAQIEKEILKEAANKIIKFSGNISKENYPLKIFNKNYISDVINLNFDLIAEESFSNSNNLEPLFFEYKQASKNSPKSPLLSTLYFDINGIRFWHPHGSVKKADSILLGLRSYFKNAQEVELLRGRYKAKTKNSTKLKKDNYNWFDMLTTRPVLICGASLSSAEWDIWLAIVNRYRNFSNFSKKENPIFTMKGYDNYNKISSGNVNHFYPISSNVISYAEEWKIIQKAFKF